MKMLPSLVLLLAAALTAACGFQAPPATEPTAAGPQSLVLMSHDSFAVSEDVVRQFEAENNVRLEFLKAGDAGEALNKACLSKDAPLADVFFGVDNTFLSRALACDIFEPYPSPALASVPDELELDPEFRLLPVDFGYVTLNYDRRWFADRGLAVPETLEDLTQPAYQGLLVTPNPATSSPGLAFLLTTIGHFGDEGQSTYSYLDFWRDLRANDVLVTDGWSEAYFTHFTVGSGGQGDRPLVVSYSTSPPADVYYSEGAKTEPDSANLDAPASAFRQVEFAGILRGTQQRTLAEKLVDFLLSQPFQEDIPLQMFVYPASSQAVLPALFEQFGQTPADPVEISPEAIDSQRETWIEAWTDMVLR